MNALWWILGFGGAVLAAALGDLLSEEVRGWLDRVPNGLLAFAVRRMPVDQRESLLADWTGELYEILRGAESRPVLRLIRGMRFAFGFIHSGPSIGRVLGGVRRQPDVVGDPEPTADGAAAGGQRIRIGTVYEANLARTIQVDEIQRAGQARRRQTGPALRAATTRAIFAERLAALRPDTDD